MRSTLTGPRRPAFVTSPALHGAPGLLARCRPAIFASTMRQPSRAKAIMDQVCSTMILALQAQKSPSLTAPSRRVWPMTSWKEAACAASRPRLGPCTHSTVGRTPSSPMAPRQHPMDCAMLTRRSTWNTGVKWDYLSNLVFTARYHDFESERTSVDLGSELDLMATGNVTPQMSWLLKFADYDGPGIASGAGGSDQDLVRCRMESVTVLASSSSSAASNTLSCSPALGRRWRKRLRGSTISTPGPLRSSSWRFYVRRRKRRTPCATWDVCEFVHSSY